MKNRITFRPGFMAIILVTLTFAAPKLSAQCNITTLDANFKYSGAYCVPAVINFTDLSTSTGGITSWTWDFGNGHQSSNQNPTVLFDTAGRYPVLLHVTSPGCADDTTIFITILPLPTSTFTTTSPVCVGENSTITYSGDAASNAIFSWDFGGGNPIGFGAGPYLVYWVASGLENVVLTVTDSNGCASSTNMTVAVDAAPTATFTATSPVCAGQSSFITYTGDAFADDTYLWNFGGGTATSGSGQGPYLVTWNTAGTPNIALQVIENGCSSPLTTIPVVVEPVPTATFTLPNPVCRATATTLTFTGSGDINTMFNWNFGNANLLSGNTSGPGPFQLFWNTLGPSVVILSITDNGCTNSYSDSFNVEICTGLATIESSPLSIYPNPTKNDFTVEFGTAIQNGQVEIYDVLGHCVYASALNNVTPAYKQQIHLAAPSGVYLVRVSNADRVYAGKLVVE